MHFDEDSDEYLDDPILLIDLGRGESDEEELEIQDLITIEDEGIIDISYRFNQRIFDKYINSFVKDTSILPHAFCQIKQNIEFLDTCRPLSVRLIDCNAFLLRRDKSKIFYNTELEKDIQSRQNSNITYDKFKEIMANQHDSFDVDKTTNLNNNIRDNISETDNIIQVDNVIDDEALNNVNEPKSKTKEHNLSEILEPCDKVNCITLSTGRNNNIDLTNNETNTNNNHSNKIVPHFHVKKDARKIKGTEQNFDKSYVEQNSIKTFNNNQNNIICPPKDMFNVDIFSPINSSEIEPQSQDKNMFNYRQDFYNQASTYEANKSVVFNNNTSYNAQGIETETLTYTTVKPVKRINKNMDKQTKKFKFSALQQNKLQKMAISVQELQNKYFNNSANLVNTPNLTSDPFLQNFDVYPTQVNNLNASNNIVPTRTQNMLNTTTIQQYGNNYNTFRKENYLSTSNNNIPYTPYLPPLENQYNANNINLVSRQSPVFSLPKPKNNFLARYENSHIHNCDICRNLHYNSSVKDIASNNALPSLNINQPYLPTSVISNGISKNNHIETWPINSYGPLENIHPQDYTNINNETSIRTQQNEMLITNNVSIANRNQQGDISNVKSSEIQEFNKNLFSGHNNQQIVTTLNNEKANVQKSISTNNITNNVSLLKTNVLLSKKTLTQNQKQMIFANKPQQNISVFNNNTEKEPKRGPLMQDQNLKSLPAKEKTGIKQKQKKEPGKKPIHKHPKRFLTNMWPETKDNPVLKAILSPKPMEANQSEISNTANIRPNLKPVNQTITGYSPPILPIPTYQKTFEILAQVNLKSKFKINSETQDIDKTIQNLYNQEKILSTRRITHDMQQYTQSSGQDT